MENKSICLSLLILLFLTQSCKKDGNDTSQPENTLALSNINWSCYSHKTNQYIRPADDVFERVAEGLKIYGTDYRRGADIHPVPLGEYPIHNKTIYFKWKANGGGSFMGMGPRIFTDSVSWVMPYYMVNLTTDHSYLNSYVIISNEWYYTRIEIGPTSYTANTSTGNYDDNGGVIIQSKTAALDHEYKCFGFGLWDCYASHDAYAILGEVRIE